VTNQVVHEVPKFVFAVVLSYDDQSYSRPATKCSLKVLMLRPAALCLCQYGGTNWNPTPFSVMLHCPVSGVWV
jgi:hypothetical protein